MQKIYWCGRFGLSMTRSVDISVRTLYEKLMPFLPNKIVICCCIMTGFWSSNTTSVIWYDCLLCVVNEICWPYALLYFADPSSPFPPRLVLDFCALPTTDDGQRYLGRWAKIFGSNWSPSIRARLHISCTCRLGAVKIQINDQGREFVNTASVEIHTLTAVKQRLTSAYHPQSNGLAEWNNRTIQNSPLKTLSGTKGVGPGSSWCAFCL